MMRKLTLGRIVPVALVAGLGLGVLPAAAATGAMHDCAAQYKAEKAAGKLKPGETWAKFHAQCAKTAKAGTQAAAHKTTAKTAHKTTAKEARALTPAQVAAHKRMKECGVMWRKDKAAGKVRKGETWPTYWHSCSDKLKKAG